MQNLILLAVLGLGNLNGSAQSERPVMHAKATAQRAVVRDAAPRNAPVSGTVVGISDGDTITVLTPEKERIQVRLAEIDAPESSQAFGQRSKQALSELCFRKTAEFVVRDYSYNRVVGRVTCDGKDAASAMVKGGMAWVYDRYVTDKALYSLQKAARVQKVGLWSDPNAISPWQYRKEKRK